MGSMTTLEWPADPVADHAEEVDPPGVARTIASLGSWMVILGAIRLVCAIAEYATAYREALAAEPMAAWRWGAFLRENPPVFVLIGAWPLLLGLALRRTRWPELVKAGALTFLILSIGGAVTATADWSHATNRWVAIGSFHVPRMAPGLAGLVPGLAGALQLLLELVTGARAALLAFLHRDGADATADRQVVSRRSRFGGLAVCASIAFLVLTIRVPAWSAYLELLSQSQWIRELILREDLARLRSTRPSPARESQWARDGRILLNEAHRAWGEGRYVTARDDYRRLSGLLETIPLSSMTAADRQLAAGSLNNAAWLLATCPDLGLRNHPEAVKLARRAIEIQPNDFNTWNTLGVAYFRLGAWEESRNALYRSMELNNEGNSFDWFFLSMIHARLGHNARAREWYHKAVQWSQSRSYQFDPAELHRFQSEAAAALGLPKPEPPPAARWSAPPAITPRAFRQRSQFLPTDPAAPPH